jgi:hypothetical protein
LLGNGSVNNNHSKVVAAKDAHATMEELLVEMFSVQVTWQYAEFLSSFTRCEKHNVMGLEDLSVASVLMG